MLLQKHDWIYSFSYDILLKWSSLAVWAMPYSWLNRLSG